MRSIAKRFLPTVAQRRLRGWIESYRHASYAKRRIHRRYGEIQIVLELVDRKGENWYERDGDFDPELKLLRNARLTDGACVFDLGAHQGVVALALAHCVRPAGQVIAVEANPFDVAAAEQNRILNDCQNLQVVHAAIGAEAGTVEFLDNGRVAYGDKTQPTVTVPTITIDDLAATHGVPTVLFVDVDGFEMQALRGASRVLRSLPDCYIEVHSDLLPRYGDCAEQILDFFPQANYELLASHEMRPSRREFAPLDPMKHDFSRTFHLVALAKSVR